MIIWDWWSFHLDPVILICFLPRIALPRFTEHHIVVGWTKGASCAFISIKPPFAFVAARRRKTLLDALIFHDAFGVVTLRANFLEGLNGITSPNLHFLRSLLVQLLDKCILFLLVNNTYAHFKSGIDRSMITEPKPHYAVVFELFHLGSKIFTR